MIRTLHTQVKETTFRETKLSVLFKIVLILYTLTNFSGIYKVNEFGDKVLDLIQIVNILCGIAFIYILSKIQLYHRKIDEISMATVELDMDGIVINYKTSNKDCRLEIDRDLLNSAVLSINDCGINIVLDKYSCVSLDGKTIIPQSHKDITIMDNWSIIEELINALQCEVGLMTYKANNLRDNIPCK